MRDRPSWVLWWVRVRWYQSTHEAVVAFWSSQPLQARIHTSRACRTRSVPLAVKTTASYLHGKIILINGIQLISLMLDYGVAVQKVRPVHGARDRRELLRRLSGLTSDPFTPSRAPSSDDSGTPVRHSTPLDPPIPVVRTRYEGDGTKDEDADQSPSIPNKTFLPGSGRSAVYEHASLLRRVMR